MKPSLLFCAAILISSASCSDPAPFIPPLDKHLVQKQAADALRDLFKRQNSCPAGYSSCSNGGLCCQDGTTCTQDAANNIACCPTGAACTGTLGGTASGNGNVVTSSNTGFQFPQSTTVTTTPTSGATAAITGSTVSGAQFPFVYIPTTFANAATCESYYSQCQSEYSSCVTSLGGAFGVTVAGAGGGVTVQGAAAVTSAQSICSSLSQKACFGLQQAYCSGLGTASATSSGGQFITGGNAASRRTSSLHDLAIAVVAGLLGMFV
jgi:hypothetical protein